MGMCASVLVITGLAISLLVSSPQTALAKSKGFYQQTNLVSNLAGVAKVQDKNLVNAWGIAFGPTTPFWISDNGAGVSTLYNGQGTPFPAGAPLVVTIPPPKGSNATAAPTGMVFNGTSDFAVSANGTSASSLFIFDTEDGTISGWSPNVDRTHAILAVDNSSKNAVYKGLAMGQDDGHNLLFATNFHSGAVDVFDAKFHWVKSFTDKHLPKGYAPFGISNINGYLVVTFALQDQDKHDDVKGAGHGFVDVFDTDGRLHRRLISRGALNSPWGLAVAPDDFGRFSHALLVGNFGNGRINAYSPFSGRFLGTLEDEHSKPITIDGLWALTFGNGSNAGATTTLFFTAGPNDEQDGLFGSIMAED